MDPTDSLVFSWCWLLILDQDLTVAKTCSRNLLMDNILLFLYSQEAKNKKQSYVTKNTSDTEADCNLITAEEVDWNLFIKNNIPILTVNTMKYPLSSYHWVHPCELNGIHYLTLMNLMKYIILSCFTMILTWWHHKFSSVKSSFPWEPNVTSSLHKSCQRQTTM